MSSIVLPRHPGLTATTRLQDVLSDRTLPTLLEWAILLQCGVIAACSSTFLDLGIQRVSGHAILRVVFPFTLGLAVVPRRGAGCVMGVSAGLTGAGLQYAGFRGEGLGFGALTSLIATGPLLDWTLRRTHGGWRQLLAFTFAGLSSNLLALGVRGLAKFAGWEAAGRRPLGEWLTQAVGTYILCGVIAGLISSAVLFSVRPRRDDADPQEPLA